MNLNTSRAKDLHFSDTPSADIANAVISNGFAVLRGAIEKEQIKLIHLNLEKIYLMHRSLICNDPSAIKFFTSWGIEEIKALENGNCSLKQYEAQFGEIASTCSFLEDLKFQQTCSLIFKDGKYHRTGTDTLMTVSPSHQYEGYSTVGIDMHTDGMYFNDSLYGLTVWIPLQECGRDAPSLDVIVADHHEVRRKSGFALNRPSLGEKQFNFHHYKKDFFAEQNLRQHFPLESFLTPEFTPGDVMLFSNWAIHGTNRNLGLSLSRSAIQLRLEGNHFDPKKSRHFLRRLLL